MSANSFRFSEEPRIVPPGPRWTEIEPLDEDREVTMNKKYIGILQKVIKGNCRLISPSEHVTLKFLVEKLEQEITEGRIRCPPIHPPAM